MSKEACVIILDVGSGMSAPAGVQHGSKTFLDVAKECVSQLLHQRLLFPKKQDQVSVLLVNANDTDNVVNDEQGGYENIFELSDWTRVSTALLKKALTIHERAGAERGDAVDGLLCAHQMLKDTCGKLKWTKRIYLFTDGSTPILDDAEGMDAVAAEFNNEGIKLNVIGAGFSEPVFDSDSELDDDEDEAAQERKKPESPTGQTEVQKSSQEALDGFCDRIAAGLLTLDQAWKLMMQPLTKKVGQVTKVRTTFDIGELVQIPVYGYTKTTQQASFPSLKDLTAEGKVTVKETTYWNLQSIGDEEPVEDSNRTRSYQYGKELIPLTPMEEAQVVTEKCVKVLGFLPKHKIPVYRSMAGVDILTAEPGNSVAATALSALIKACDREGFCAVARYVARANSAAKIAWLLPHVSREAEFFYIKILPFNEDVRAFRFQSLKKAAPDVSDAQRAAARGYLQAIDLGDALQPESIHNPMNQRFYGEVKKRALLSPSERKEVMAAASRISGSRDSSTVPASQRVSAEVPAQIKAYMTTDPAFFSTKPAVAAFEQAFPVVEKQAKGKGEKRHWRDRVLDTKDKEASSKRAKASDAASSSSAAPSLYQSVGVEHVGRVSPLDDFKALFARESGAFSTRAVCEMFEVVVHLVTKSMPDVGPPKAIECLKLVRSTVVAAATTPSSSFSSSSSSSAAAAAAAAASGAMDVDTLAGTFNSALLGLHPTLAKEGYTAFFESLLTPAVGVLPIDATEVADVTLPSVGEARASMHKLFTKPEATEQEEEEEDVLALLM